jgi:hypothetical protein
VLRKRVAVLVAAFASSTSACIFERLLAHRTTTKKIG